MIRVNFRIPFGILMLLLRMSFDRSHGIPWLLGVLFLFGAMVPPGACANSESCISTRFDAVNQHSVIFL